jgi:arylamine N-acetyltransferase
VGNMCPAYSNHHNCCLLIHHATCQTSTPQLRLTMSESRRTFRARQ